MKPILVYFCKPKDLLAFGAKARKDPQVDACEEMDKDLWARWVITELAKEFVCVKVNVRKADSKLLRKHRVARAPVVSIFDFNLKQVYFTPSPRLRYSALSKVMNNARIRVEAEVKKLAASDEDTPLVHRAKARAQVIEQRELYDEGLTALEKKDWACAEEAFNKAIAIEQESDWKKQCKVGLVEVSAGKAVDEAERFIDRKRFKEAKDILEKVLKEYKEAKYFTAIAKERLEYCNKKLS